MKVWPIDPLVPRNLRLEVPEKLPQGLMTLVFSLGELVLVGMSRIGRFWREEPTRVNRPFKVNCPCVRIAFSQFFKSSLALQLALGMPAYGYGGLAIQR